MPTRQRRARKLLIASIGVATMSYVAYACSGSTGPADAARDGQSSGDARTDDVPVANLVAPPVDSGQDVVDDFPVANLVAPPVDGR